MQRMIRATLSLLNLFSFNLIAFGAEPAKVQDTVDVPREDVVAHDPVLIKEADTYYLFTTGPGVSVWSSSDMDNWTMLDPVFDATPDWAMKVVPGFRGHMWAPDISYHDGRYLLYYSVSTFGSNDSCIGMASNVTLDPSNPDFEWKDHGVVVRSEPGLQDWNAIDPNLVFDEGGQPFLAFGSFWSGLKLAPLNESLDRVEESAAPIAIASRRMTLEVPAPGEAPVLQKGNDAIEGPFIYRKGDYYYLFASVDYCCRGKDSTYKMVYGRSKKIEGPYLDRDGQSMLEGGGTLLKEGNERWHGLGHNGVSEIDGQEYAVFHGYDGETEKGLPKLLVEPLSWTEDGWPELE
ncbi:family 43 glycosylhydrolase [Pelagicoccus sp. SDUM812002]|uniref:family 43 glycosylhydrolase n=1 Tax=Pelagicoccus sp. SDUM812002 TaxID=3041266 RepID=UPI00280CF0EB|nr:family 43 glycosylhydrolase [Pelagicoccus sp. SDUM812002]MDQ8185017.1 family 43 glycosylhydrolase [Pelagicoccus sp. SDUM812002]